MDRKVEEELARLHADQRFTEAATLLLSAEGARVLGYLTATLRDGPAADEVYARTIEAAWAALPRFEQRSSFRTWIYGIARRTLVRWRREGARRRDAPVPVPPEVAQAARSDTAPWLRSDVKDRFAEIRAALSEDEIELLVLRIDRQMSWGDIAAVVCPEDEDQKRAAARLRKRFQLLVERVREQARAAGLLQEPE